MRARDETKRGGAVVVSATITALGGEPKRWPHAAAKAGAVNLVRSVAIDLATSDIWVNAVLPGPIRTGMTDHIERSDRRRFEALRRFVPMQRWAEPEHVADAIGFLASPAASFITGTANSRGWRGERRQRTGAPTQQARN